MHKDVVQPCSLILWGWTLGHIPSLSLKFWMHRFFKDRPRLWKCNLVNDYLPLVRMQTPPRNASRGVVFAITPAVTMRTLHKYSDWHGSMPYPTRHSPNLEIRVLSHSKVARNQDVKIWRSSGDWPRVWHVSCVGEQGTSRTVRTDTWSSMLRLLFA